MAMRTGIRLAYGQNLDMITTEDPPLEPRLDGDKVIVMGLAVVVAPLEFKHFKLCAERGEIVTSNGAEVWLTIPVQSPIGQQLMAAGLVEPSFGNL